MKRLILFFPFLILLSFNGNAQGVAKFGQAAKGLGKSSIEQIIKPRLPPTPIMIEVGSRIPINPHQIPSGAIPSGATNFSGTGTGISSAVYAVMEAQEIKIKPFLNDFIYEKPYETLQKLNLERIRRLNSKKNNAYPGILLKTNVIEITERRKKEIEDYFLNALEAEIQAEPIRFNFNFEMEEAGDDGAMLIIIFNNLNLNVIYYEYKSSVSVA